MFYLYFHSLIWALGVMGHVYQGPNGDFCVDVDYDDNGDHDDHEHEDGKDDQLPVHAW